jgi:hypothetical protein
VVEGWLDLAKLVASEGTKGKSPYEELAFKIGGCPPHRAAGTFLQQQY